MICNPGLKLTSMAVTAPPQGRTYMQASTAAVLQVDHHTHTFYWGGRYATVTIITLMLISASMQATKRAV